MPTVFLKKGKKTYQAKVKMPDGRWKQVSTKVKIGGAAAKAKALETAFSIQKMVDGIDRESPSEAYFLKLARDVAKTAAPGDFKEATLAQFLRDWITDCEERTESDGGKLSRQTFTNYQSTVNTFLGWAGEKGEMSFRRVTPQFIKAYIDYRKKDGKSGSTVGKDLTNLTIPFETALNSGKIAANPFKAVRKPAKDGKRRVLFSAGDVQMMVKSLSGEWLTVFLFGLYTGARLGDCVRMRWESVDIFKGTITFTQKKTRGKNPAALVIPLHSVLWEHLKPLRQEKGLISPGLAAKVSVEDEGDDEGTKSGPLSVEFGQLMEAAGVDRKVEVSKVGRQKSLKSFHSLRHTINSAMANQGKASEEVRSRLTGHKLKGMNQHYTHTEIEEVRSALKLVFFAS